MTVRNLLIILSIILSSNQPLFAENGLLRLDPVPESINAVRFDPSYYYNAPVRANVLAEQLAQQWQAHAVNVVFYKAYDPVHGAKYKTEYALNVEADYGRQNLLKYVLAACSERGIRVMAWIPAFQHKNAWEKHPEWRVKNADRTDYRPDDSSYPLCAANPEVRRWWLGFLGDLLERYPALAGVDVGEPVVQWQNAHCHCNTCSQQQAELGWLDVSALGLSQTLLAGFDVIHQYRKIACVTSVASPKADGDLYTPAEQRSYTGFDLQLLLDHPNRPDWISLELMWQQWADLYKNPALFQPTWVKTAAAIVKAQVAGRSRLLAHLELTPFGLQAVDVNQLKQSILAAKEAEIPDVDLYDTHQIDRNEAWPAVQSAFAWQPIQRALIVSDPLGQNDARQVAGLLSHFQTETKIILLDRQSAYQPDQLKGYDQLFYIGVDPKFSIPIPFLKEVAAFKGTLSWIHYGIDQYLTQAQMTDYGFRHLGVAFDSTWNQVQYQSTLLIKQDPDFNQIAITDSSRCVVHAWMVKEKERLPYALQSHNLWYFADLTTAFVIEGGSYIVFADLLHDILGQNHRTQHLAMVRIEDISPLSDITSLRRIADYLHSEQVPFAISLVPFYLDPASNTAASLSDQPDLVEALHYMIRKGGVIVMHGNTHQYRGETTSDYEFWDMINNGPLFSDSKEYVRERIETGLAELAKNKLYPVTWETPHYGASQIDYAVINEYFTSAYERRQTIDLHGSDQLVPWLIERHAAGGKIIPENLGYIPLEQPEPGTLLKVARNHLALRDGIASFFFHPFVDLSVLEEIILQMKRMGYSFTDPRYTSQQVRGKSVRILTGSGNIELALSAAHSHEFFLDRQGAIHDEIFSSEPRSDTLRKAITVPEGWIYVAEAVPTKPKGVLANWLNAVISQVPKLSDVMAKAQSLSVRDEGPPIVALLYTDETSTRYLHDQSNWQQALATVGVDASRLNVKDFFTVPERANIIIVPYAAALKLNQQQIPLLVRSVQNGTHLILERPSSLSAALGITATDSQRTLQSIVDEYYPTVGIQWSSADTLFDFNTEFDYTTYASDPASGQPVVIGSEYGSGRYLYWATLFDPDSEGGYGRFPFMLEMLRYQFKLKPLVRREALEIYFDPGSREDISIEDLVKMWRKNGTATIHVAGWHTYPDYTYDYGRLVELAHQNAMRVYLWLELPHVSEKFWLDHPQWRERNALNAEVDTSGMHWRRPMALQFPACREAVMTELRTMLLAHDWDGINLAELQYESAAGPAEPKWFMPMNQAFRGIFQQRHGYDPLSLFDKASGHYWQRDVKALTGLYQMREEQIIDLHRQFLQLFKSVEKQKKGVWEIIVTTIDAALAPEMATRLAVNTVGLAALDAQVPFTLELEEPPQANSINPQAYLDIIRHAKSYGNGQTAMVTVNLVERSNQANLTTRQITGLELYRTIQQSETTGARLTLNSEASLYEVDTGYLASALASATRESLSTTLWQIDAASEVSLQLDPKQHPDVLVDGDIWPAYHRGRLILSPGIHQVRPLDRSNAWLKRFWAEGRLVALSGELLEIKQILRGLTMRYRSPTVNWVVMSEKPHKVLIDDKSLPFTASRGELGFSFALPAGEHRADIYTTSRTSQTVKGISLVLSGLIAGGGLIFGTILGFLYLKNSRWRRKQR